MKITSTMKGTQMNVYFAGELDHHAAGSANRKVEELIEAYFPRDCVIDMSGMTFMDSSGIAVILKAYRQMNAMGGRLWIENVPPQPMRVLDASGIERLIKINALT